jgi:putative endonuclease
MYLLASRRCGTLYVGSTTDLARRMHEHKTKAVHGFTRTDGVDRLVWFEFHERLESALLRERQMKFWRRAWKIMLIEENNPHWIDLTNSIAW